MSVLGDFVTTGKKLAARVVESLPRLARMAVVGAVTGLFLGEPISGAIGAELLGRAIDRGLDEVPALTASAPAKPQPARLVLGA